MKFEGLGFNIQKQFKERKKLLSIKKNKNRILQLRMLVLLQDAKKMDFFSKFDALWLDPYHIWEVFDNNSLQLETLNGELFPIIKFENRWKEYRVWKIIT